MKYLLRAWFASSLLVPAAILAASFEGKITMKMTSAKDKPQEINYSIKGDKVRMEFPNQKDAGGMIIDTTKREMMMIMNEQKMYMTMAMPDAAAKEIEKKKENMDLEKTGETEKILGYTATKYISTSDGTKTDMWLAEGLGAFMGYSQHNPMGRGGVQGQHKGWEKALAGKELFPLRVIGRDGAGKENFRMEVTAIDKKTLPDSLFAPPDGYQKFDMGGMMRGMIPGRGR